MKPNTAANEGALRFSKVPVLDFPQCSAGLLQGKSEPSKHEGGNCCKEAAVLVDETDDAD